MESQAISFGYGKQWAGVLHAFEKRIYSARPDDTFNVVIGAIQYCPGYGPNSVNGRNRDQYPWLLTYPEHRLTERFKTRQRAKFCFSRFWKDHHPDVDKPIQHGISGI